MRVLIDVVHPAHVHFYRALREVLLDDGHAVEVVARDKDVTHDLLEALAIPYRTIGRSGATSRFSQARELAGRVLALAGIGREFRPDVVLTRNPAGVQAARLVRAVGIFDTDDGRAAGVHFRVAAPFAHVITSPESLGEHYGDKHRQYDSYKPLAYLHPDRFTPDVVGVRRELGVDRAQPLFVLRFVSMTASHDHSESGMPNDLKLQVARRLAAAGHLVVSSEGPLPPELDAFALNLSPDRIHHLLAAADLYVGDSQTMAGEAALLGTPTLRVSSWAGRLPALDELESRYRLLRSFKPDQAEAFEAAVGETLENPGAARQQSKQSREQMLAEKVDVTAWYARLIDEVVG